MFSACNILFPKEEVSNNWPFIFFKAWIHSYTNYQFMWNQIQKCLYQRFGLGLYDEVIFLTQWSWKPCLEWTLTTELFSADAAPIRHPTNCFAGLLWIGPTSEKIGYSRNYYNLGCVIEIIRKKHWSKIKKNSGAYMYV